ncbi:MAG: MFS transporter [Candidatus Nanopelagicales bacterium]|nr:MFS transporter [Candidatus Nanopelagicales bacterium]MDZ4250465.1 MFS transporter [Candidatus Nanopelagicales bacterium]
MADSSQPGSPGLESGSALTSTSGTKPVEAEAQAGARTLMLVMATAGFAINFWAWALLSPLAPAFKESLGLSHFQQAMVVAVPVIVGSVGRIPVGALTDRYGGRLMFPAVSLLTIIPVMYLGLLGQDSLASLLIGGFFLGIGGTAFAIGIPFVNGWFPPERRGFALGLFGVGMGGTAIAALTTVNVAKAWGDWAPFAMTALALLVYSVLAAVLLREPLGHTPSSGSLSKRLAATMKLRVTWYAAALYAVVFGGYVAFSVYLVAYLETAYGLARADAAFRMAGFVVVAVALRPVGGWLSDRMGPGRVLIAVFFVVAVCATVQAFTPSLMPVGTVAFLTMAGALGAGCGATFCLVAVLSPEGKVGAVSGFVGAAGGLGGFVPPLIMGATYGIFGTFAIGLGLLVAVAVGLAIFTMTKVRRALAEHSVGVGIPAAGTS